MKLKSISRTANCSWSPEVVHGGIFLAAGTTAQQIDASFNTSSQLEILNLNITSAEKDLKPVARMVCERRFHKVIWGSLGTGVSGTAPYGMICAGTDDGSLQTIDVNRLLNNENAVLACYKNHGGPVHALDLNPFQNNLLASGSSNGEVFIWDLGSPKAQPYSPGGTGIDLPEEVACLAWNQQVQHIIASAFSSRCTIWDLRKSEPIIRLNDASTRFRCKAVAWNPMVATQLCLASENDHCPWLHIWDLRYASSPVKTLEKHSKGILSVSWNPRDQDLLVSCGRDSSVCLWNPNGVQGSELLREVQSEHEWNFEVLWCPRNPELVSVANFNGEIAVYSVIGGEGGKATGFVMNKVPSWLYGCVGARFAFGGKLVSFCKDNGSKIDVAQVDPDKELTTRIREMEDALWKRQLDCDFWKNRVADESGRLWQFINALGDPSKTAIELQKLYSLDQNISTQGYKAEDASRDFEITSRKRDTSSDMKGTVPSTTPSAAIVKGPIDATRALITGDVKSAITFCVGNARYAEALFLADFTQDAVLKENIRKDFLNKHREDTMCRLVACISSNLWEELVEIVPPEEWLTTLTAIVTYVRPQDSDRAAALCAALANRFVQKCESGTDACNRDDVPLLYFLTGDLTKLATCYKLSCNIAHLDDMLTNGALCGNEIHLQGLMEVITASMCIGPSGRFATVRRIPKELSKVVAFYVNFLVDHGHLSVALNYLDSLDTENDPKLIELRDRILVSQGLANTARLQTRPCAMAAITVSEAYSLSCDSNQRQVTPLNVISGANQFSMHAARYGTLSTNSGVESTSIATSSRHMYNATGCGMAPYTFSGSTAAFAPMFGHNHTDTNANFSVSNIKQSSAFGGSVGSLLPSLPVSADKPPSRPLSRASGKYPALVDPSIKNSSYNNGVKMASSESSMKPAAFGLFTSPLREQAAATGSHVTCSSGLVAATVTSSVANPLCSGLTRHLRTTPAVAPPSATGHGAPLSDLLAGNDYTRDARYSAPGWNDPPPLRRSMRSHASHQSGTLTQLLPVTAPLTTASINSTVLNSHSLPHNDQPCIQLQQSTVIRPQQLHFPSSEQVEQFVAPAEKSPIPSEYADFFTTFERLRIACQAIQNNLVQKKLDEVSKKMDNLGDKLRQKMLSEVTVQNLRQIANVINAGNYENALHLFAHVAQTSSLSETSGFMPGIKTLLAIAQQHQIYA